MIEDFSGRNLYYKFIIIINFILYRALSEIINHIIYYRNNNEFIVLMKIEDKKRKVKIIRNL